MHDAVAGLNDVDILKSGGSPVDKVEPIIVAAIFDGAVLFKGMFFKTGTFNG